MKMMVTTTMMKGRRATRIGWRVWWEGWGRGGAGEGGGVFPDAEFVLHHVGFIHLL